jgi:hypothetical protein
MSETKLPDQKVGFTGSRHGCDVQALEATLIKLSSAANITEFHHGDCVGADADAHKVVQKVLPKTKIVIHPPLVDVLRAFCEGGTVLDRKSYLERNRDIVDAVDFIIAAPKKDSKGTLYTMNYAKRKKVPVLLVGETTQQEKK